MNILQGIVNTSEGKVVRAFHRFTLVDQTGATEERDTYPVNASQTSAWTCSRGRQGPYQGPDEGCWSGEDQLCSPGQHMIVSCILGFGCFASDSLHHSFLSPGPQCP